MGWLGDRGLWEEIRSYGRAPGMGLVSLMKGTPEDPLTPFWPCEDTKRKGRLQPEEAPNPAMLAPGTQTSRLRPCEKQLPVVCKPPGLRT